MGFPVATAALRFIRFACRPFVGAHLAAGGEANASAVRGLRRWLLDIHNDHRALYAALSVVTMIALGLVLAVGIDFVLKRLGYATRQLERKE